MSQQRKRITSGWSSILAHRLGTRATTVARCTSRIAPQPPGSGSLYQGLKSSALASEIPPITAALPLTEAHAPPGAQPSPPVAVRCTPCANSLPKIPDRTSHSAPAQTRAPESRTLPTSAGRVRNMRAPGTHLNLRLPSAHPRAAAPATSPNSAVPHGTSQSALTAVVDTPRRAALCNHRLRSAPTCQRRRTLWGTLKFQQSGFILGNHTRARFYGRSAPGLSGETRRAFELSDRPQDRG